MFLYDVTVTISSRDYRSKYNDPVLVHVFLQYISSLTMLVMQGIVVDGFGKNITYPILVTVNSSSV